MRSSTNPSLSTTASALTTVLLASALAQSQPVKPVDYPRFDKLGLPQAVLRSVGYGEGRFVAVGDAGVILSSSEAQNWTKVSSPATNRLNGITYGQGKFVAVGSGTVVFSTAASSWLQATTGSFHDLLAVTYGGGLFVAASSIGTILTSTDAATWVARSSGVGTELSGAAYGNGMFVIVGGSHVLTSSDGLEWVPQTLSGVPRLRSVTFGNGVFVATTTSYTIYTSPDGTTWTNRSTTWHDGLGAVVFDGQRFVALDSYGVSLSDDGDIWTQLDAPIGLSAPILALAYGGGTYAAVGGVVRQALIATSEDAVSWTLHPGALESVLRGAPKSLAFGEGKFVAVAGMIMRHRSGSTPASMAILTSSNGLAWIPSDAGTARLLTGAAYGRDRFVAVGTSVQSASSVAVSTNGEDWDAFEITLLLRTIRYCADRFLALGNSGTIAISLDGYAWQRAADVPVTNWLNGVAHGPDSFVAVGDGGTVVTSKDASFWSQTESGSSKDLLDITYGNGVFVLVGAGGTLLSSNDGIAWTKRQSRTLSHLRGIVFANELFLVVGDSGLILSSTDGMEWNRVRSGTSEPLTAAAFGDGKFLVMGSSLFQADLSKGLLIEPAFRGDHFELSLMGEIGGVYQVQAADDLRSPDWRDLRTVTNLHLTTPIMDLQAADAAQRFYRVVPAK